MGLHKNDNEALQRIMALGSALPADTPPAEPLAIGANSPMLPHLQAQQMNGLQNSQPYQYDPTLLDQSSG